MKPETLKSILSLVRNADNRTSGVGGSGSDVRDIGDKSKQSVTSDGRDSGSDDVTRDVICEESSPECDKMVDAALESRRSANESCDPSQDEQMRLATEGLYHMI